MGWGGGSKSGHHRNGDWDGVGALNQDTINQDTIGMEIGMGGGSKSGHHRNGDWDGAGALNQDTTGMEIGMGWGL